MARKKKNVHIKKERTEFEFAITKEALKFDIPVLGICGGQQLLNVVMGGSLIQHIPAKIKTKTNHEQKNPRNQPSHSVKIIKNTKLSRITKKSSMYVNSAHHQAVEKLGKGLIVNAVAEDGIIEGIESTKLKFCLGIQWHPEFLIDEKDIEIFKSFIRSARKKN